MTKQTIAAMLLGSIGFLMPAQMSFGVTASNAQSVDPSVGRQLAERVCSACHQISAASPNPGQSSGAPSFVDISQMPSASELSIKVFLRTPHPSMPNFILSPEEIDSVTAYILSLARK
ncbi:c-type cytochrome [Methylocapsa sp. D3K7]|uniref:c-type cytochrome n=1 Tax=Methylocapsa sp. D3K7 TaxID=3041435 RepID=UPI00244EB39F|nr:c-type cytochrome [Methylocapsa sp. D3K7]WGJ15219.1 c-type cytochrome [Methylocapsa sp. D3K7]